MSGVNRSEKQDRRRNKTRKIKEKYVEERATRREPIVAKTANQKVYIQKLRTEKLIVARGPAGSGKTYIPSALAADALVQHNIEKIIIARPYVEMGKGIGFRKGSEFEKLYSFLRPMLDTIKDRMGAGAFDVALARGDIEVQSLDAIRGRSFDGNVVVIVDEFQNATPSEVQSIVTRIGEGAQMVLCGDPHQHDLKGISGIDYLENILEKYHIQDAAIVNFTEDDIVRSSMAKDFVIAFRKDKETK